MYTGCMQQQVIVISTDGEVISTHLRKGKNGIHVQELGRATILRATDIQWVREQECWSIQILEGSLKGSKLTYGLLHDYIEKTEHSGDLEYSDIVLTESYEDAVEIELEFLNSYRLRETY